MYSFVKRWIVPLLRTYHRIDVIHQERIPTDQGYVLVANHQTILDPFYIGSIIPQQPFFMAKQEAFEHWFMGRVLRGLEAFPVKRGATDMKSIRFGLKVLQEDKVLGIFPEGGRRQDKDFGDLKQGAAYFAKKGNRPIVPMYIHGSEKAMPKGTGFPRPIKLHIFVGQPIDPELYDDYKEMGKELGQVLQDLQAEAELLVTK